MSVLGIGSFYGNGGLVGITVGQPAAGGFAITDDDFTALSIPAYGSWEIGAETYVTGYSAGTVTCDQTVTNRTGPAQFSGFDINAAIDAWAGKTNQRQWCLAVRMKFTAMPTDTAAQSNVFVFWQSTRTLARLGLAMSWGYRHIGANDMRALFVEGGNGVFAQGGGLVDWETDGQIVFVLQLPTGAAITPGSLSTSGLYAGYTHTATGTDTADTWEGVEWEYAVIPIVPGAT
jgi:hypothetical protein